MSCDTKSVVASLPVGVRRTARLVCWAAGGELLVAVVDFENEQVLWVFVVPKRASSFGCLAVDRCVFCLFSMGLTPLHFFGVWVIVSIPRFV